MTRWQIARRAGPFAAVGLWAAVLTACGSSDATSTTSALPAGCRKVPAPAAKHIHLRRPSGEASNGATLTATVETSCGRFTIALDPSAAPRTVRSFTYLARKGVYDDTSFDRIVPGFLIQGGDPTETGTGGPGYSVTEPPPPSTTYRRGRVAMAKSAVEPSGRSGSQFFVVTTADAGLPPQYAPLGTVSSGSSVVRRIESVGDPSSGQAGTPRAPVVIRRITVSPR
jgi:cyclophilin family peptidyl-prolyl cis-trans isomerase